MVCIPCIVAPLLLWIWYKFIQPVVLKIWNPWEPKKTIKDSSENAPNEKKATCPIGNFNRKEVPVKENTDESVAEEPKKEL